MIWRKGAWWLCLGLVITARAWGEAAAVAAPVSNSPAAAVAAAPVNYDTGTHGIEAVGGTLPAPAQVQSTGNTGAALNKPVYEENHWLEDFEVHFLVSLPFTALYSYLAVSAVDATVQGRFPTTFSPVDTWTVMGLALGSSLAVALGSIGRVPDQSIPRIALETPPDFSGKAVPSFKVAVVQVDY